MGDNIDFYINAEAPEALEAADLLQEVSDLEQTLEFIYFLGFKDFSVLRDKLELFLKDKL